MDAVWTAAGFRQPARDQEIARWRQDIMFTTAPAREMQQWIEYLTHDGKSPMADLREKGHKAIRDPLIKN